VSPTQPITLICVNLPAGVSNLSRFTFCRPATAQPPTGSGLFIPQFAQATCGTIRLKLLKIGALVRVSVRRVKIAMASACPWQHEFGLAHALLANAAR
jgi:Transposase DDE domain group 1